MVGQRDKLAEVNAERFREPIENIKGRVPGALLYTADVGHSHFRIESEAFLRDAACDPQPAQIQCDTRPSLHGDRQPACSR